MAKFNKNAAATKMAAQKTINEAGGEAYKQSPELELASIMLTSMLNDQYYRSADDQLVRVRELLGQVDPEFAAKAAVYARAEIGMRSISHVVAAELAPKVSGQPWGSAFYRAVVQRPDDMMEILSYRKSILGVEQPVTHAIEKGFRGAFDKFDAYSLGKYRGEGKAVKLVDAVNLVHPKSKASVEVDRAGYIAVLESKLTFLQKSGAGPNLAEQVKGLEDKIAWLKIENTDTVRMNAIEALTLGLLRSTGTWETGLVKAGQSAETDEQKTEMKADVWKGLLESGKLGYMALVKNLRNIIEQAPALVKTAAEALTVERAVRNSKVLPFRLLAAYKEVEYAHGATGPGRVILNALEAAIDLSLANMPELENTLVAVDNSGSMSSPAAGSDKIKRNAIGAMFGIALAKQGNADIMEFGSTARYMTYRKSTSALEFASTFESKNKVGHGTSFAAVFATATKRYDRIVFFSDEQGWLGNVQSAYRDYQQRFGGDKPYLYMFNLASYGTMMFPETRVLSAAGFSEKIFDVVRQLETDPQAMVNTIRAIDFANYAGRVRKPKSLTDTAVDSTDESIA